MILDDLQKIRTPSLRAVIKLADLSVNHCFNEYAARDTELVEYGFSRNEITELIGMISCALYMVNLADSLSINVDKKFLDIVSNVA